MSILTVFMKNKNIIFKIRRSKVTDYAALKQRLLIRKFCENFTDANNVKIHICQAKMQLGGDLLTPVNDSDLAILLAF